MSSRSEHVVSRAALGVVITLLAATMGRTPEAAAQTPPQEVILDGDGDGDFDELVAVMTAAVSPEIDLLGVVVTGSEPMRRARTVAKALRLMGRPEVGVYLGDPSGSPRPSVSYYSQFPARRWALFPRLADWASDFPLVASTVGGSDFILEQARRHPGEVTVIATAPLSTLANALRKAAGEGVGPRPTLKQIYFSGGDFKTAEYNIYEDVGAAATVFRSGIPIYQFGGEGEGKAYLTHEDRQRLWSAETPATWALQDYYRLYEAGWDPTSPFVPILYDVHPLAVLIQGETISQFAPMTLDVDPGGRLVLAQGPANAHSRVSNRPDLLLAFVERRLTDRIQPAANHLRAAERLCAPHDRGLAAEIDSLLAQVLPGKALDGPALGRQLAALQPRLAALGKDGATAEWHLGMARGFLLGQRRDHPWRDPYTPAYIRAYLLVQPLLSRKRASLAGALLLAVTAALVIAWRRRSRGVAGMT